MTVSLPAREGRRVRKRTFNTRLIKRDFTYFVSEIADLFQLHPNAVRRWIKAGLSTVDGRRPLLVHGGDLIDFLNARQARRKQKCGPDEFYCCRCRGPRRALLNRVEIQNRNDGRIHLSGVCATCGTRINRAGSLAKIEEYRRSFDLQTLGERRIRVCPDPSVMCHSDKDGVHAALQPEK